MNSHGPRLGKLRLGCIASSFQATLFFGAAIGAAGWSPQSAAVKNAPDVKTFPIVQVTPNVPITSIPLIPIGLAASYAASKMPIDENQAFPIYAIPTK